MYLGEASCCRSLSRYWACRICRCPAKQDCLSNPGLHKKSVDRVKPETRDAAFVPEARLVKRIASFTAALRQFRSRLLNVKVMVVILFCSRVELPGQPAKRRRPIVGRLIRTFAVPPDVPISMRRCSRRFRVDKPFVLVGGVVDHKIENDFDVALLPSATRRSKSACERSQYMGSIFS